MVPAVALSMGTGCAATSSVPTPTSDDTEDPAPTCLGPTGACSAFPVDGCAVERPPDNDLPGPMCLADEGVDARCVSLGIAHDDGRCLTLAELAVAPQPGDYSPVRFSRCGDPEYFVGAWATSDGTGCIGRVEVSVQFDPVDGRVAAIASWAYRVGHCPTFRDAWCCGQGDDRTRTPQVRWGQPFPRGDCARVNAEDLPGYPP